MKAEAPPCPARYTYTDETWFSKYTQERGTIGLPPIPRGQQSGLAKKGGNMAGATEEITGGSSRFYNDRARQ